MMPTEFTLSRAYPNPFNPVTTLNFALPEESDISIIIYNLQGRQVATLTDGVMDAGYHSVMWDGIDDSGKIVAAGIYFYSLQNETSSMTRKMVYMK